MSHASHTQLPGYNERDLLHDGCQECDHRAGQSLGGALNLDATNLLRAWQDMRAYRWSNGDRLPWQPSLNYTTLLNALYEVGVLMERAGLAPEEVAEGLLSRVALETIIETEG